MERYEVYLHIGLLDALPKSRQQRRRIMDFIYSLRDEPRTEGDYAITYWLDDPVKSVMVVDVRLADR